MNTKNTQNTQNTQNTTKSNQNTTKSNQNTQNNTNTIIEHSQEKQVKSVSFGNLNIIVSKKINVTDNKPVYSNDTKKGNIVEDEYSDEEKEADIQTIINKNNNERFLKIIKNISLILQKIVKKIKKVKI